LKQVKEIMRGLTRYGGCRTIGMGFIPCINKERRLFISRPLLLPGSGTPFLNQGEGGVIVIEFVIIKTHGINPMPAVGHRLKPVYLL
jgi:hypothetical protein